MRLRRDVHRNVIDRFTAKADQDGQDQMERIAEEDSGHIHYRRFIRMVAVRKQAILERLLMDES